MLHEWVVDNSLFVRWIDMIKASTQDDDEKCIKIDIPWSVKEKVDTCSYGVSGELATGRNAALWAVLALNPISNQPLK